MDITKKVVLLYDFFSEHGGIERIMLFQARALKRAGYDVTFAFAYVDEALKKERLSEFEVIEYAKMPIKNETLQICSSILKPGIVSKFKDYDLVICHSFPSSYLALRIKKKFKIPFIFHLHHPPQFLYNVKPEWAESSFKRKFAYIGGKVFNPLLKKFDYHCTKGADYYCAESEVVKKIIRETYGINGEVLYPTIDKNFIMEKSSKKELYSLGITKNYILGSGRIIRQKRFDYLIRSFSKLKNKKLQLVLAGKYESSEKENLEKIAKENKVKILFLGPQPPAKLRKLYNLAKLTVLTCPKEWFGLVPVEAMACGCPVIAWQDNFGPQETVIKRLNGFLAKPYNIDDMTAKIEEGLKKKWDKERIVRSVSKFSEEKVSQQFISRIEKFI